MDGDRPAAPEMRTERDVAIPMDDGVVLRADVFRPLDGAPVPVIMTLGPYGKGLHFGDNFPVQWERLIREHPELLDGSTGRLMNWETVDPERWVPAGYAVVRVDARGAGRSPGRLDIFSPRETRDYHQAIEWAGTRPWSNGRVGLCGISYYAMNQWTVAALRPPHLAAIVPWEGSSDHYREFTHHGGMLGNGFLDYWYPKNVLSVQHGRGEDGPRDTWTGDPATGPETLTEAELAANRADFLGEVRRHPLDDDYHRSRTADLSRIEVPLLSAANWGGLGLHSRGNFEGYTGAGSRQKWLEVHTGRHEERFYLREGLELQRRFFDHFLKGEDNGWERQPPVLLSVRRADGAPVQRYEREWPLARTRWTRLYLDAAGPGLCWEPSAPASLAFDALSDGVTFLSEPLAAETEITGPAAAMLRVASTTADADLFLTLRAFRPDGLEIDFQGANDPHAPLSQGWLRASHRRTDPRRSLPHRPYQPHGRIEPLRPGFEYRLEIELWPTCIVLPPGCRLALTVAGRNFTRSGTVATNQGSGGFLHTDPDDRGGALFAGRTELRTGGGDPAHLLLPVVPAVPVP